MSPRDAVLVRQHPVMAQPCVLTRGKAATSQKEANSCCNRQGANTLRRIYYRKQEGNVDTSVFPLLRTLPSQEGIRTRQAEMNKGMADSRSSG